MSKKEITWADVAAFLDAELQDENDELTRMCAPDPDIPTEHAKTADEIRKMCGMCSYCGKDGKNGVD